jgi:hypothetical protein
MMLASQLPENSADAVLSCGWRTELAEGFLAGSDKLEPS